MKTNKNKKSELKNRPDPHITKQTGEQKQKPVSWIDHGKREANRMLGTEAVVAALRGACEYAYERAEIVGEWVWVSFDEPPTPQLRAILSQLGFHWNNKRQVWQHPCGQLTQGTPNDPREKYPTHFPADGQPA